MNMETYGAGWDEDFLERCLKNECKMELNNLDKNSNYYMKGLMIIVEDSKMLADIYSSQEKKDEMIKYNIVYDSALRQLNKYLFD
ncbi:MAG: hypothetical protein PHN56_06280 [Candidatus Nanoarchaeia archaeon]|nr:hypothetical protein [Candidatus Nanoarchaeia archaeon]